jgi:hypothetical protein
LKIARAFWGFPSGLWPL